MRGSLLFIFVFTAIALAPAAPLAGQDSPLRVGVLFWHDSPNDALALRGVRDGFELAEIKAQFTEVNVKEDPVAAQRTLRAWEEAGYDLIYALGTSATRQAKRADLKTPTIFTAVTNPVGSGIAPSWEGTGINVCGNSNWIAAADVLDVFAATVPGISRLGVVHSAENPVSIEEVAEALRHFKAKPAKAIRLIEEWIEGPEELEEAVTKVLDQGAQALWIPIDIDVYKHLDRVVKLTAPRKIPLLASQPTAVRTHAVVGVGVDYRALGEKSVVLAKQVLAGKDPATLPIGRMRSFRVIVNLDAARRTGFTLPLALIATADEILDVGTEER